MTTKAKELTPGYSRSRALVIGINQYSNVPPLSYATNDAKAIAELIENRFEFNKSDITLLLDKEATRDAIMATYLSFADNPEIGINERLLVYYAGHGHTITGQSRHTGFLVACNSKLNDISSLIRWKELVDYTDLINSKHILFILDACFSGLAFQRDAATGDSRFLDDIFCRRGCQVMGAIRLTRPLRRQWRA